MNRFLFPKLSYIDNATYNPDFKVINPKHIACIFTMNSPLEYLEATGESKIIGKLAEASKAVYGHGESIFIVQTVAFDDYRGLQFTEQFVESQQAYYKEHFPKELDGVRELGRRLVEEAGKQ